MAEEPVDIGAITEALTNKTDTDVQNTTTSGDERIAHLAMPSDTYDEWTFTQEVQTFTAPADGYAYIGHKASAVGQYFDVQIRMSDGTTFLYGSTGAAATATETIACMIPVRKGNVVRVATNFGGTQWFRRFFYVQGSEPQA